MAKCVFLKIELQKTMLNRVNEYTYITCLRYFPLSLLSKLQKVHDLDFQTRYHPSLQLNGLQNCQLSNFDNDKIEVDLLIFQS